MNWHEIDRFLMGEAWAGSRIDEHLEMLCNEIGPRWSGTEGERGAVAYIHDQMQQIGLDRADMEEFELDTWNYSSAAANVVETGKAIDLLLYHRCPSCDLTAPLVDAGYGTPQDLDAVADQLSGAVAIMHLGLEPFTAPVPAATRLAALASAGVVAIVVIDTKSGGRIEYHNAGDWRDPRVQNLLVPTVTTSREHGALLLGYAKKGYSLHLIVAADFFSAPSANVASQLTGSSWPDEHLLIGGHHDTVMGTPGGNDNSSGVVALLETARVLSALRQEISITPGRSICFVTFAAEEQQFQGSTEYVTRHYAQGANSPPRLAINLDELSTGHMKGIVLAFPHLRELVQRHLDEMHDSLHCHVMAQLDPTSDHLPFLRAGIDAAHVWRWRFRARHADSDYHHEPADTADKVNVRELKEHAGQLARLLLRLSHVPPGEWPENPLSVEEIADRLERERDQVIRVY